MKRSSQLYPCALSACLVALLSAPSAARAGERLFPAYLGAALGLDAERNVPYVEGGGSRQQLDICFATKGKPRPLIVWIHGGGWRSGSKEQNPALFLVKEGYAVASINYRLTDKAAWPAQIEDCKAAIRYLRAHADRYRIDPDRIGVWGGSAGGHLAAMLGTTSDSNEFATASNVAESSAVQAVCDWFGPTNFCPEKPDGEALAVINPPARSGQEMVEELLGGSPSEKVDVARSASPVTFATADDPPFLIMHGADDRVVPVAHSRMLAKSLKDAGVSVKLKVVPEAGHAGREWVQRDLLDQVRSFFDRNLKG